MGTYEVQVNDSPAKIAARFAGCPKCAVDLVKSNPHKPTVAYPNGFVTFRSLVPGEVLSLPDKWLNGDLESRPPSYFRALPFADGVTPGTVGSGVLGDYAALDAATARVGALASMDDQSFSNAVGDTGSAIDSAISEAFGSSDPTASARAQDVQNGTQWAWTRNADLASALTANDSASVTKARLDIQNALSTALGNARLALQAFYSAQTAAEPPTSTTTVSPTPVSTQTRAPTPAPVPVRTTATAVVPPKQALSTGTVVGIGLLGAAAVGSAAFLATRKPARGRR